MSQFKADERTSIFIGKALIRGLVVMLQITDRCVFMYDNVLFLFFFQEADLINTFGKPIIMTILIK